MCLHKAALRVLYASAAIFTSAHAAFGPAFSTGAVSTGNSIINAVSTLIVPELPTGNAGFFSLWVGMGTSNGNLIQSIANTVDGAGWETFCYTLEETGPNSQKAVQGPLTAVSPGDHITMHYKYNSTLNKYTQYLGVNGKVVHTQSTKDGKALGWGSAVECAATNSWIDTTITLDFADPDYIDTLGKSSGVTGNLVTKDKGKTWTVKKIGIPQFTFTN